eukprot:3111693-Pleurochrysis_carterae.AAC.1
MLDVPGYMAKCPDPRSSAVHTTLPGTFGDRLVREPLPQISQTVDHAPRGYVDACRVKYPRLCPQTVGPRTHTRARA